MAMCAAGPPNATIPSLRKYDTRSLIDAEVPRSELLDVNDRAILLIIQSSLKKYIWSIRQ